MKKNGEKKLKIFKNDSGDIAFVENCLMSGAISQVEVRQWLIYIIEIMDELPTYVFDLLDTKDFREMFRGRNGPIGFFTSSDLNDAERDAITGIAYKRGYHDRPVGHDVYMDRAAAMKALEENPHIEARFRKMFPFIEW